MFFSRQINQLVGTATVCVALLLGSAPAAWAQFGWSGGGGWGGGWDPDLQCVPVEGSNQLIQDETGVSFTQDGKVHCTFTDPALNTEGSATCTLHIDYYNLNATCSPDGADSQLTVTGVCPTNKEPGILVVGSVDCSAATNGGVSDPAFCGYAGNDPGGNSSGDCTWNLGIASANGKTTLAPKQCDKLFNPDGSNPDHIVFSFTQGYAGPDCVAGSESGIGSTVVDFCHSDTWDGSQFAFCDFVKGNPKNLADGEVINGTIVVDIDVQPETINTTCPDEGRAKLTIFSNSLIDVKTELDLASITLNGFAPDTNSCGPDTAESVTCHVPTCHGTEPLVKPEHIDNGVATLELKAQTYDGDPVSGKSFNGVSP